MPINIVILDGHPTNPGDLDWAAFEKLGRLTVYDHTPPEEVARRIGDAQAVLTGNLPITRETMDACPALRYIGILATGYDMVDVAAARNRGIVVANVPAYSTNAVGQFAIALLLEICHQIGHHDRAVHQGRWAASASWCFWDTPLIELAGKTMGIIGFGRIGQTTGRIAKALGMDVIACDEYPTDSGREIAEYLPLENLLARADVIGLHCPLIPATRGIINRHTIGRMKDGVILLNNSRGDLIVEQDLADALNTGKVYAAGLDVASMEPITADNPLLHARNCIITPHISWATRESRQRLLDVAAENIRAFVQGEPIHAINL